MSAIKKKFTLLITAKISWLSTHLTNALEYKKAIKRQVITVCLFRFCTKYLWARIDYHSSPLRAQPLLRVDEYEVISSSQLCGTCDERGAKMRVSSENSRCFLSGVGRNQSGLVQLVTFPVLVICLAFYVREREKFPCARVGNKTFKREQADRSLRGLPRIV